MRAFTNVLVSLVCSVLVAALQQGNSPQYNENDVQVQKGALTFGIELLKILSQEDQFNEANTLISPINVYSALNMLYLATGGKSLEDLSSVLGLPGSEVRAQIYNYAESLSKLISRIQYKHLDPYAVISEETFANGIFVQNTFPIGQEYVADVQKYFPFTVAKNLDFANDAKGATDEINKWIAEKTQKRIPQLYKDPLDSQTVVSLVSSLYFNGKWKEEFPERNTKIEKFSTGTSEIDVKMMNNQKYVPYIENKKLKFEAIRLPYQGYEYEMIFILPNVEQKLDQLVKSMKVEDLQEVFNGEGTESQTVGIDYKIPKMKFSWTRSLKDSLSQQGLKGIFESMDMRYLTNATAIKISDVQHATEIEIDEFGTKASAVTGLSILFHSLPVPPLEPKPFYVNRPFMMVLYHRPTNTVQFTSLVHKPTAQ